MIDKLLIDATERLRAAGIADPRREASSLLAHALGRDRTFLIAHPEYEPADEERSRFESVLARRAAREPLQYIIQRQEFYGLDFEVGPDVLIPRPETELIVGGAIEHLRDLPDPVFCEIGTGSGCITVATLANVPSARAVAVDISEAAISVAHANAVRHSVADRVGFLVSDVFESIPETSRFDAVLSNPPYVAAAEIRGLQPEVRDFEPRIALTDESDGLSIVRRIIADTPRFLRPGGLLLIEIGAAQSPFVAAMIDRAIWNEPSFLKDLQSIERTLSVTRK